MASFVESGSPQPPKTSTPVAEAKLPEPVYSLFSIVLPFTMPVAPRLIWIPLRAITDV